MQWLLIAWIGAALSGSPVVERFSTEAECEQAAMTLIEVAGLRNSPEVIRWRCIEVAPLAQ
jgi:hypothetical protein